MIELEKVMLLPVRDFLPSLAKEFVQILKKEEDYDPDRFLFIMPNRRSGIYLRYYVAKELGTPLLSPPIFSFDDFIDYYYENFVKYDNKISTWDAIYLIFECIKDKNGKIFSNFWDFIPFGEKIYKDFEELKIFKVESQKLRAQLSFVDLPENSKIKVILELYPDVYDEFYKRLDDKGFSTRSSRYSEVADRIGVDFYLKQKELFVSPPYLMSPSEILILEKLFKLENTHLILQETQLVLEEIKESLPEVKVHLSKIENNIISKLPEVKFITTDDEASEVLILREKLKELGESQLNSLRTAVVLPNPRRLLQVLDFGLPEKVKEFNVSMGYPVRYSTFFTFLEDLVNLLKLSQKTDSGYLLSVKHLARLLKQHLLHKENPTAFDALSKFLEDLVEKGYSFLDVSTFDSFLPNNENRDNIRSGWDTLYNGFLTKILDAEYFRDIVQLLLELFGDSRELPVGFKLREEVEGVAEYILAELKALQTSYLSQAVKRERASLEEIVDFLQFITSILGKVTVPLKGTPLKGLQIIGFLETRLLSFEDIFILDVQEGELPQIEREWESLLPIEVKSNLGLFDPRKKEKLYEYFFFTLLESASRCSIICKNTDKDEPSHFILLLKEKLRESGRSLEEAHHTYYTNKSITFNYKLNFDSGIQKTEELLSKIKGMTFSYSVIKDYLDCPIRFLFAHVYSLQEEIEDEYDPRRIGTVIHKIMERFFKDADELVTKDSKLFEKFRDISEIVLNEEYPVDSPRIRLMKEAIKTRLENNLRKLQSQLYCKIWNLLGENQQCKSDERDRQIEKVIEFLGEFQGYEVEKTIYSYLDLGENAHINFKGKVDRMDIFERGVIILDYKSSSKNKDYETGAKIDGIYESIRNAERISAEINTSYIQLPVYFWLLNKYLYEQGNNGNKEWVFVGIVPLKEYNLELQLTRYKAGLGNSSEDFKKVDEILRWIVGEILDPNIEFYPPEERKRKYVCTYCPFNKICRTV